MPSVVNTLFPPIISTFQPAFINTTDPKIYFTYSPLSDIKLIKKVHLSLVNQVNNENALSNPTGVLIYEVNGEAQNSVGYDTEKGMYYVTIPRAELKGVSNWNINQFYKVQIRIDQTEGGNYDTAATRTAYLSENILNFSEWSTVCLIRPILEPQLILRKFEDDSEIPAFNKGIMHLSGYLSFGDSRQETETLQAYKIQIIDRNNIVQIYIETDWIYTGNLVNPNEINYRFTLQDGGSDMSSQLILRITCRTKNQFEFTKDFNFNIVDYAPNENFKPSGDGPSGNLITQYNESEGIVTVHIKNDLPVYGTLFVKRASNKTNFTKWESIYEEQVHDAIDIIVTDNTVGCFVIYQYSVQLENTAGGMSEIYYTNKLMPTFEPSFFTRGDQQLGLRYDFNISSLRPVVTRAKIDTLGGKYPKFVENAVLNYKQFTITGLISAEADYNQVFLNKRRYYGSEYNSYESYKTSFGIAEVLRNDGEPYDEYVMTTAYDYYWEREFREAAMAWLNDGEPKIFRSPQEGVMAVMLMDVNLMPKENTNRMLYTFSATMYEIAEADSLDALSSLGIIDTPRVSDENNTSSEPVIDYSIVQLPGQVYKYKVQETRNEITIGEIYKEIADRYAGGVYSDRECFDFYIKDLKIYFESEPHFFDLTDGDVTYTTTAGPNTQLGYSFNLQTTGSSSWTTIFVNSGGYYQVPFDLDVTGLSFNQIGDIVTLEYIVVYKDRMSDKEIVSSTSVESTITGQLYGVFQYEQYLGDSIRKKYNYTTEEYTEKMVSFKGISVDVTPYAILNIKYKNANDYNTYIVGRTGILYLLKDFDIDDIYFAGRRMTEVTTESTDDWECIIESSPAPEEPLNRHVYNNRIYYNNTWYNYKSNGDGTGTAIIPIEGSFNYLGDILKLTY